MKVGGEDARGLEGHFGIVVLRGLGDLGNVERVKWTTRGAGGVCCFVGESGLFW